MAEQPPATVLPGMQLVDDDDDDRLADFADGDRVGFVVYMNQYEAKISILAQRAQERRRRRQTSALVFLLFIVLSGLYLYSITRDTRGKYQLENARFAPIALVDSFGSSRSRVCARRRGRPRSRAPPLVADAVATATMGSATPPQPSSSTTPAIGRLGAAPQ